MGFVMFLEQKLTGSFVSTLIAVTEVPFNNACGDLQLCSKFNIIKLVAELRRSQKPHSAGAPELEWGSTAGSSAARCYIAKAIRDQGICRELLCGLAVKHAGLAAGISAVGKTCRRAFCTERRAAALRCRGWRRRKRNEKCHSLVQT